MFDTRIKGTYCIHGCDIAPNWRTDMGFWAKVVTFCSSVQKAETTATQTSECTVWRRTGVVIDFDRVTGVEKLLDPKRYNLGDDSYKKAGIYMVDVLFRRLPPMLGWNTPCLSQFAPPFLMRKLNYWEKDSTSEEDWNIQPTVTTGGSTYVICEDDDVKGRIGGSPRARRQQHNDAVQDCDTLLRTLRERDYGIIDPPFFWCSCADLFRAVDIDEKEGSEPREVVSADPLALAIVHGWHEQIRHLSHVGAYGLLSFS